jgi:hypothetical protein
MIEQEQPAVPASEPAQGPALNPMVTAPWTEGDREYWRTQIEQARKLRNATVAAWDAKGNLERYTPKTVMKSDGTTVNGRINVAKDFADVERKNAALFYNTPQVSLVPDPGTNPLPLMLHSELLNTLMNEENMDVLSTVSPTIQDCLVAIQPAPTEIGYSAVTVDMPQQVPVMDPMTQQPAVDPMTGQPQMQEQIVPVVVWEEFFWTPISPKAILLPCDLKNTKYDKSPWQGYDFRKPTTQLKREFVVPEDFSGADLPDDGLPFFEPLTEQTKNSEPHGGGSKIWYRAHLRDPNVTHPEVIRELVLLEGMDEPVVHRDLPYQEIGPDGRLTPASMVGYPGHPLALRHLTDSQYVAADCTITAPLTRELNKSRTQNMRQRDASKLHVLIDSMKVVKEIRDKIGQGDEPTMIPVEAGALDSGKMMEQVPRVEQGRESFLIQDIIERDRAQILGIDANQVGSQSRNSKTATEISTVQRNADARFERERQQATRWFLRGVQKLSALVLRYGDRIAVEMLGPQRGQLWKQARDQGLIARFSFRTVMDSGNYVDISERTRQDVQTYNLTAKDPMTNRGVILARMATDLGLDPSQWIVTKPPESKPEPPNVSISVKPEDLDPALPSYVGTYAILTAGGMKGLPPPTYVPPVQPNPAEHGGMAEQAERLNQHQLEETGQRTGPKVM